MKGWLHLLRLWSLTATGMPVLVAGCFNAVWPRLSGRPAALSPAAFSVNLAAVLVSCGSLQLACNLLNTWGDFRSGVDAPGRRSSRSELLDGLVTPGAVLGCAAGFVGLGVAAGFYLLVRRFSFLLLGCGALGVLGSVNYTTGARFKYRGLGVPFVFLLMGPLLLLAADLCLGGALAGAAAGSAAGAAFAGCAMLPVSGLVAAILHANDMRDCEDDAAAGIVTPAIRLGARGAARVFALLHLLPAAGAAGTFLLAPHLPAFGGRLSASACLPLLLPCALLPLVRRVLSDARRGLGGRMHQESWRCLLPRTARLHLLTGLAQAASFFLVR